MQKGELQAIREELGRLEAAKRETEAGLSRVKGTGQALKDDIERLEREYGDVMSRLARAKTDLDLILKRLEDAQKREQDGRKNP